eukprot:10301954-Karenia_brevis.AAC.1
MVWFQHQDCGVVLWVWLNVLCGAGILDAWVWLGRGLPDKLPSVVGKGLLGLGQKSPSGVHIGGVHIGG